MRRSGLASWIVVVAVSTGAGCDRERAGGQPSAPAPSFVSRFQVCAAALPGHVDGVRAVYEACGPLVGDGACLDAWRAVPRVAAGATTALHELTRACATRYCPALPGAAPAACGPEPWPGDALDVWVALHAAILSHRFPDRLRTTPDLLARYQRLPPRPSAGEVVLLQQAAADADPTSATLDGRPMWFGLAARLLAMSLLAPALEIEAGKPVATVATERVGGTVAIDPGCGPLQVAVRASGIVVGPGARGRVLARDDHAALAEAVAAARQACASPAVEVTWADDVSYQDVVTAADSLIGLGLTGIDLDAGGAPQRTRSPRPSVERARLRAAPKLMITSDEVVAGGAHLSLATADLEAAVTRALAASTPDVDAPPGLVVLQADRRTRGAVLRRVVRGARAAGYDDVLFAVAAR